MTHQILKQFALALVVLGSQGCGSTAAATKSPAAEPAAHKSQVSEMPASPWSVLFADGNANSFRFWQEMSDESARFEYTPVTPAESSSGNYSGGAPMSGELSPAQADELWVHVNRLRAGVHAESRMMGTGSFAVTTPDAHGDFIVGTGPTLDAFVAFVQPFRGQ